MQNVATALSGEIGFADITRLQLPRDDVNCAHIHRRKIKTEGKAKVVAAVWGEEFIATG